MQRKLYAVLLSVFWLAVGPAIAETITGGTFIQYGYGNMEFSASEPPIDSYYNFDFQNTSGYPGCGGCLVAPVSMVLEDAGVFVIDTSHKVEAEECCFSIFPGPYVEGTGFTGGVPVHVGQPCYTGACTLVFVAKLSETKFKVNGSWYVADSPWVMETSYDLGTFDGPIGFSATQIVSEPVSFALLCPSLILLIGMSACIRRRKSGNSQPHSLHSIASGGPFRPPRPPAIG